MDIEKYIKQFYNKTKNPTLATMRYFMEKYDNPQDKSKIIHIGGTNGKGSCTEILSNILIKSGYKVGKFISPHLVKYNERISINNNCIKDKELEEIIEELNPIIEDYNENNNEKVTFFELTTIIAFIYFYRKKCDFVILEVGIGGLYDCTNIINPIVSIITSIGYDHMNILGNTLEEIAIQKAGIIKENSKTIFLEQENNINEIIENTCKLKNNELHFIKKNQIKNHTYNKKFQKFDYKKYKNILLNLKGEKQIYNATNCLEAIDILKETYEIPEMAIREGLQTVIHKARFEKINDNPIIIYDGAHNESAIINLKNSINMYYKNNKKVYVISILQTKDYMKILELLISNKEDRYIFTNGNDENKYVSKDILYEQAKKILNSENIYKYELKDSIDIVKEKYKDCVTFVVGSFYTYGQVIDYIK